ncbi:MAG: hypothetical protein ABIP51_23570, partial [Bacteroidia bacterium]
YINWLTYDKKPWAELTHEQKKGFNVFIVNRFLSMDLYLCEAINAMQEYTLSMDKEIVWKVYLQLLPKEKLYLKYIKPEKIEGLEERDISLFIKHFNCREEVAIEYLQLLKKKGLENEIENIKSNYKYE